MQKKIIFHYSFTFNNNKKYIYIYSPHNSGYLRPVVIKILEFANMKAEDLFMLPLNIQNIARINGKKMLLLCWNESAIELIVNNAQW